MVSSTRNPKISKPCFLSSTALWIIWKNCFLLPRYWFSTRAIHSLIHSFRKHMLLIYSDQAMLKLKKLSCPPSTWSSSFWGSPSWVSLVLQMLSFCRSLGHWAKKPFSLSLTFIKSLCMQNNENRIHFFLKFQMNSFNSIFVSLLYVNDTAEHYIFPTKEEILLNLDMMKRLSV